MAPSARNAAAVALLMVSWWITEAVPFAVTALLPLALLPLLRVIKTGQTAAAYAHHYVFLLLGGFFIALAMQKWGLHRRIALRTIKLIGVSPRRVILGFMVASAFLSMWISNTATTMMMMPIGLAVILHALENAPDSGRDPAFSRNAARFSVALMLGIAHAASVGGIGTLIGTAPNIVFAGMVHQLFPNSPEIGFFQWFMLGLPLVIVFVPIIWAFLVGVIHRIGPDFTLGEGDVVSEELKKLGRISKGEVYVLGIFVVTVILWIFRRDIGLGFMTIPGWSNLLGIEEYVQDSSIVILTSSIMFFIPVDRPKGEYVMDWEWAAKTPWGILILFGGGFALANGFQESGLAEWIGSGLQGITQIPTVLMIFLVVLMVTFLTELTSNTATTMMMPILAAVSVSMGIHPFLLALPATIAASCAFMLPVATPPNAIVFGSGHVTIPQMAKTGLGLNLIGVVLVTVLIYLVAVPLFGIDLSQPPAWLH